MRMKDRRIFERILVNLPLKFLNLASEMRDDGQTCDISAKGVGILTKTEVYPRTPLDMWVDVPDKGEPVQIRGTVVWSHPIKSYAWRAGLSLEKEDLMGISRILRTQKKAE